MNGSPKTNSIDQDEEFGCVLYMFIKILVTFFAIAIAATQPVFAASGFSFDFSGKCKVWNPNIVIGETLKFNGNCKNDFADGFGTVEWIEKNTVTETWTGFFINGFLEGKARVKNSTYDHTGIRKNSEWDGEGRRLYNQGTVHEGTFKGDFLTGFGIIRQNDGTILKGWFRDGLLNGYGEISWRNGTRQEGDFLQGKLNGYGAAKYSNGGGYQGQWRNGKYEGIGILSKPDGSEMPIAIYSDGKFIRHADAPSNSSMQRRNTPQKSIGQQELELLSSISNTHNILNQSSSVNIIAPDGRVTTGTMWSTQQPGTLGGSTFIQSNK